MGVEVRITTGEVSNYNSVQPCVIYGKTSPTKKDIRKSKTSV